MVCANPRGAAELRPDLILDEVNQTALAVMGDLLQFGQGGGFHGEGFFVAVFFKEYRERL